MKKLAFVFIAFMAFVFIASCDDTETYAEQKDKEKAAIKKFLQDSAITVINESQFKEQGYTTDLSKNEFVLMKTSGVYMQIVREGCGEKIKDGETATVLCRFTEYNILEDTLQLTNNILYFASVVDKMTVINTSGTFTGSFIDGESVMAAAYGSTSVPSGWLVPFTYIKVGRPQTADEEIAKVNLIVPHDQGHIYASSEVYPCYYTITYERGR
ncbi:MAG: DUF4827 domain-containing protein [Prevotella sp.]|nr:DUF4827 domain-containing protein [Prevotella sp.]